VLLQDVLVGALVVHHSNVAKVARGDELYLAELLLAGGAGFRAHVAIGEGL
jgi:hypothetical protein